MTRALNTPTQSPRASGTSSVGPLLIIGLVIILVYLASVPLLNMPQAQKLLSSGADLGCASALECAFQLRNPTVPAPLQLLEGFRSLSWPPFASTSVPFNLLVTAGETLAGIVLASLLGILLAVGMVSSRALERSILPLLVASQTIPIVALTPMLAVTLGQFRDLPGWVPKAIIAAYIAFFPICVGLIKGLRSPDPLQLDLMRTYNANTASIFFKLRFPASLPYLFTAYKVAVAAALIGAIVAEGATVSFVGIGKMLSENSRAADSVALWVIMLYSGLLGIGLVALVNLLERIITPWKREVN